MNSSSFAESCEATLKELKSWQRTTEAELESQFERIRSIAGRVDRSKRKEREVGAGENEDVVAPTSAEDEQSRLNQLLAKRLHGGGIQG